LHGGGAGGGAGGGRGCGGGGCRWIGLVRRHPRFFPHRAIMAIFCFHVYNLRSISSPFLCTIQSARLQFSTLTHHATRQFDVMITGETTGCEQT
jgi:hypothetical protein